MESINVIIDESPSYEQNKDGYGKNEDTLQQEEVQQQKIKYGIERKRGD